MFNTFPINDNCIDCGKKVDPCHDRQEMAWDENEDPRRRCGKCIAKLKEKKDRLHA